MKSKKKPDTSYPRETRAKILRKRIGTDRAELHALESKERAEKALSLVGKCFKYHNSYPCPESDADRWWLYALVTGVDGEGLKMFMFQHDKYGQIKVDLRAGSPSLTDGYVPIEREEFLRAWNALMRQMPKNPIEMVEK